jgi:hypothetical protein
MAGKTVENAHTKKGADNGRVGGGEKKKVENPKVGRDKEGYVCITIAGESFHLTPENPLPPPVVNTAFTMISTLRTDELRKTSLLYISTTTGRFGEIRVSTES